MFPFTIPLIQSVIKTCRPLFWDLSLAIFLHSPVAAFNWSPASCLTHAHLLATLSSKTHTEDGHRVKSSSGSPWLSGAVPASLLGHTASTMSCLLSTLISLYHAPCRVQLLASRLRALPQTRPSPGMSFFSLSDSYLALTSCP